MTTTPSTSMSRLLVTIRDAIDALQSE